MKKIFVFFLFNIPFLISAQNYQNICSSGITFYKDKDSFLKAFRRDSILLPGNNDSIFISYTTIRDSTPNLFVCRDTTNGGVLGRKIYKEHNGWVYFFNKKNDTIKLNTLAVLNESWKYCKLPNTCYLEAKVTGIINDSVLGLTDQVKVISFQAKDAGNNNISDIFNQKQIKLSQHYGLSEIYDIYWTPYDTIHYTLAGKTTPQLGVQPFTWQDVYNFDVGDEFHYDGYYHYNDQGPYWHSIKKILAKTVYGNNDSVVYQIEFCEKKWFSMPPPSIQVTYDTVYEKYNFIQLSNDLTMQRLPDEFVSTWELSPRYGRQISTFHNRPVQTYDDFAYMYYHDTHCYSDPFEGGQNVHYYSPELGLTGFSHTEGPVPWINNQEFLVYYKKGTETWGTPVSTDCNSLVDIPQIPFQGKPVVKIIPNPIETQGTIIVENCFPGDQLKFDLFDYLGRKIVNFQITSGFSNFSRENFPSGLYLYTVTTDDGFPIGRGKVVIK